MKIKLILDKIGTVQSEKGSVITYHWIPTLEKYKKMLKMTIKDNDDIQTSYDLKIPHERGDLLVAELIVKEQQTKIDEDPGTVKK